MEVSITQFRRELFELVGRAMAGEEVWVSHKGSRFRVTPEEGCGSRLGRVTPLNVLRSEGNAGAEAALRDEMIGAWESDWSTL